MRIDLFYYVSEVDRKGRVTKQVLVWIQNRSIRVETSVPFIGGRFSWRCTASWLFR